MRRLAVLAILFALACCAPAFGGNPTPGSFVAAGLQTSSFSFTATASAGDFLVIPITTFTVSGTPALPSAVTVGGSAATLGVSFPLAGNCSINCTHAIYYFANSTSNPTIAVTISTAYADGGSLNYSCGGSSQNCAFGVASTTQTGTSGSSGSGSVGYYIPMSITTTSANNAVFGVYSTPATTGVTGSPSDNATWAGTGASGDQVYWWRSTSNVASASTFVLHAQEAASSPAAYATVGISITPPVSAFTILSASVDALGQTVTATISAAYTSGSTASCFVLSGAAAPAFNATPVSIAATASSATVTIVAAGPAYKPDMLTVALAASPACAMIAGTSTAGSSSVTATNGSYYYAAGDSHWSSIRNQGSPGNVTDGNGYPHSILFSSANGSQDFTAQLGGSTLSLWSIQYGNAITLWVDGLINSRVALAAGATYIQTQFTGLDTTASHTYRIEQSGTSSAFQTAGLAAINVPAGTTFGALPAARAIAAGCGSSAWNMTGEPATGSGTNNADQTHWGLLSAAYGITFQGYSNAGQNLYITLAGACPGNVVPYTAVAPSLELLQPDSNDLAHSVTLANYQAAAQTVVTNTMANAAPPAKLFVIAPNVTANLNTTIGNCATSAAACYASYTASLAAGVAAAANANTTFVHTVSLASGAPDWLNSLCSPTAGADLQSDCLHPLAATALASPGYGKFANRYAPIVSGVQNGASWAVSGTTTGAGSVTLALAIPGGNSTVGYPTFQDPVTYTSSNLSDTVCLGAVCGTGAATMAAGVGLASVPFTVSGAAGMRTLTPSGLPDGWVAPAATSITLSAVTAGSIVCVGFCAITHIP